MNLGENPTLTEEVESDNELKTWLQINPKDSVAKQFIEDLKNLQK